MKQFIFGLFTLLAFSCKNDKQNVVTTETVVTETDTVYVETYKEEPIKSAKVLKDELTAKGFEVFDYYDEKLQDTIVMQKYFMVFLKSGPIRSQNEEEAARLQKAHREHLSRMYEAGYADLIGPFGDDGDIRGIAIYNVPSLNMADSLANLDPMVKAGRLVIEAHPWWVAKGYSLR